MLRLYIVGFTCALAFAGQSESRADLARETIELPYNPAVADIRRDRPTNTPNSWPTCSVATSSVHAPCRFVAPYPVAVDVRTIADIDPVYAWAEASTVRDGLRLAAQLDEAAQSATLAECDELQCRAIIRIRERVANERRLAACSVLHEGNRPLGAPMNCLLASVSAQGTTWLRVVAGYDKGRAKSRGLPEFEFARLGTRAISVDGLLERFRGALADVPLALTAKIAARDIVAGYSEYKVSTVLARFRPPLREMATVRIDVRPADEGSVHAVRVIVETRLLVNPQATTKREDWQLPTPPQEAAYNAAVFEKVRQALPSGCAAPLWRSDRVLTCDVSSSFELPQWVWR